MTMECRFLEYVGVRLFSDLEQLEVSSLCDGVIRFLQDLPGPVLPSSLQTDMIHAVQGDTLTPPSPPASPPLPFFLLLILVLSPPCFPTNTVLLLPLQRSVTWRNVPSC